MTSKEIDQLSGTDLEVAYAEQVLGYEYRPGKGERMPWYRRGYPELESLPHFLGWDYVYHMIHSLTDLTQRWSFSSVLRQERFSVDVRFDERGFQVTIELLDDSGHVFKHPRLSSWSSKSILLGEAFLRTMLKVVEWFRKERDWKP